MLARNKMADRQSHCIGCTVAIEFWVAVVGYGKV